MNCIIVDDEPAAIEILESNVTKVEYLSLKGTFTNPIEALTFIQSGNNAIDLVFLDVNMPNLTGLGFMELLKGQAKVILTTAYSEYALDGYKYDIVDYLTKPIAFEDFLRACTKAKERINPSQKTKSNASPISGIDDYIMVKSDHKGKFVKIPFSDIMYIESMRNYVAIYTIQREQIITLLSMKELEERLPKDYFYRTHKTYIVAMNQIKMIDGGEIVLLNGKDRVPLGMTYRDAFFEKLENKMMQ